MQIVRGCDTSVMLVYMVYPDKLIEGSPKSLTLQCQLAGLGIMCAPGDRHPNHLGCVAH